PRALPITSGERLPASGHSTEARLFAVGVEPGAINKLKLTAAQANREHLPAAMAGYLQWIAKHMDELRTTLPARFVGLRAKAQTTGAHARGPAQVAHLYLGLETYLRFAIDVRAIDRTEADHILAESWNALIAVVA